MSGERGTTKVKFEGDRDGPDDVVMYDVENALEPTQKRSLGRAPTRVAPHPRSPEFTIGCSVQTFKMVLRVTRYHTSRADRREQQQRGPQVKRPTDTDEAPSAKRASKTCRNWTCRAQHSRQLESETPTKERKVNVVEPKQAESAGSPTGTGLQVLCEKSIRTSNCCMQHIFRRR